MARHALRVRADDHVEIIAGKDKGKRGKVLRVDPKTEKVFVEGLNLQKRHTRPSATQPNAAGGVIEREGPIHVSNVMLVDPSDDKPTRVGVIREDGRRIRVSRRTGERLD